MDGMMKERWTCYSCATPYTPPPSLPPSLPLSSSQVTLNEEEVKILCQRSREIFLSQPILIEVEAPVKICGDLHGQYYDLLRLFEYGGYPPESNYLFLG